MELPPEIWVRICQSLSFRDLNNVRETCGDLASITRDRSIWKPFCRKIYNRKHLGKGYEEWFDYAMKLAEQSPKLFFANDPFLDELAIRRGCLREHAAHAGRVDLLSRWTNCDEQQTERALMASSRYGHFDCVEESIRLGAKRIDLAYLCAASGGKAEILKFLDSDKIPDHVRKQALKDACKRGSRDSVNYLVRKTPQYLEEAITWTRRYGRGKHSKERDFLLFDLIFRKRCQFTRNDFERIRGYSPK